MTVVLDTNIVIVAASQRSGLHLIFQKLITGELELAVTTEILLEYEELLQRKSDFYAASKIMDTILNLPALQKIDSRYYWEMIGKDPDDNKFIDCAIAANAKYIVSDDAHFRVLKNIDFPPLELLTGLEFVAQLSKK